MSNKRKVLHGSASNMLRVVLSMLVSLVLPPFLVHRMSTAEYSAWVLILQVSAYVGLLDLGLQTAIGKFVAEYNAVDDRETSSRILSTSFVILSMAALAGMVIIATMAWRVPQLFRQMPTALVPSVRWGLCAVGFSVAVALPFGAFLATFTGLQEYSFPTIVSTLSRLLSALAMVVLLLLHGNLIQLALLMAAFNIATAAMQYMGWRK